MTENTLIFGFPLIATALIQVLNLFSISCDYGGSIPLETKPLNLDEYDLVIAIVSHDTQVIPLVNQLRSKFFWEGKFLAIVTNETQKENLSNKSLFGTPDYKLYGKIDGHAVIPLNSPQFLFELLQSIKNLHQSVRGLKLYYEIWDKWYSCGLITELRKKITDISYLINQKTEIKDTLKEKLTAVLKIIRQIEWIDVVKDPHQDLKKVNPFIEVECQTIEQKINDSDINSEYIKQFCDQIESNLLNNTFIEQSQLSSNNMTENNIILDIKPQTSEKKSQPNKNSTKLKKDLEQSKGLKILIVEDNDKWAATLYRLYKSIICEKYSTDEWNISTAICAEQALDKLEKGEKFDLISLDINLSKTDQDWGDGRLVLRRAAELESCKAMIVITGILLDESFLPQHERGKASLQLFKDFHKRFSKFTFLDKNLESKIAEIDPDIKLKVEDWRKNHTIIEIENIISSLNPDNNTQISDEILSESPQINSPYIIKYNQSQINIFNEKDQRQWMAILASKDKKQFEFFYTLLIQKQLDDRQIKQLLTIKSNPRSNNKNSDYDHKKSAYNAVNDNITKYLKKRGINTRQIYSCSSTDGICKLTLDQNRIQELNDSPGISMLK